ncbi:hypothetical protein [Bacteroides sp. D20]|uniref:hypothetical protein n=1 Tax=Bacteroides sp. D20 TaxID=585543 RepID=UPI002541A915|nr:hypothetical protein [Bacteroides sp. D20]
MYKNEKFSFKLMISVNGFTEKPTSKDYNKISFEEKEITISELEQFIKQGYIFSCTYIDKEIKSLFGYKKKERALYILLHIYRQGNKIPLWL